MYAYKEEKESRDRIRSTPTESTSRSPLSLPISLALSSNSIVSFYVPVRVKIFTRACVRSRKLYQVPQGKSLLLGPFPCRTHERPLVVLQLLHSISASARFTSPALTTYRCYLRLKRVISARVVHLFLDDGEHYSNCHTQWQSSIPFLTCSDSDRRLPLRVSYPATCSHHREVITHLISQNGDTDGPLLIDPRMVDLRHERYLDRITNVSRRAMILYAVPLAL